MKIALALSVFVLSGIAGLPGAPAAGPDLCVQGQPCPPCLRVNMHRPHICPN